MGINRLGPVQVLTRQARLTTLLFGTFDLMSCGSIAAATSEVTLATGQTRSSGQKQATDVAIAVAFERADEVARLALWCAMAAEQATGYLQEGATLQYEDGAGQPSRTLILGECHPHTLEYPATDLSGAGEHAMVACTLSVWDAQLLPGT